MRRLISRKTHFQILKILQKVYFDFFNSKVRAIESV